MAKVVLRCPECRSKRLVKYGKKLARRKKVQRYFCNNCLRLTINPKKEMEG